ncbi:MAG TPA: fumarylacetoacetate hydrolase family protein [Intrasporangium sp.]|uniref:2-keto-4-pentenoate hydratase n=1 Tax=Intrasporangium sp. TaxID=1925024 RepID=UPI002B472F9A|nr:fumarylacetoacetate hydrolase family protein [Intrasporangium sp.]HKX67485.1 fumarylacetoacetate hydrolase family protein [Intrasporangium sp.]
MPISSEPTIDAATDIDTDTDTDTDTDIDTPAASPVLQAAERLERASRTGTPCAPVRGLLGEADLDAAYAVQRRLADRRSAAGARVVGRKIGLTSPAVQAQLGVDQPDFGVLFDDMDVSGISAVPAGTLLQPRAEAEVAFVLGADLDGPDLSIDSVRAAVDHAVAAIEIVDSRVAGWDIRITDTIADNGSSGLFVLGDQRVSLEQFQPAAVTMTMYADDLLVSEGTGAACLDDPLNALLWLARTAQQVGDPLRAGQVVLSGALGPMHSVTPGSTVRAEISSLGTVSVRFGSDPPATTGSPTTSSPTRSSPTRSSPQKDQR